MLNDWINLHALWRIVVVGLVAGAGLPAVFALGLRALALQPGGGEGATLGRAPVGVALASLCFAVVLAGIGWGVYLIVAGS